MEVLAITAYRGWYDFFEVKDFWKLVLLRNGL